MSSRARVRRPAGDAGDVGLLYPPPLELRRDRRVVSPVAHEQDQAARLRVETLVDAEIGRLPRPREVAAQPRGQIVVHLGVRGLRRYADGLVDHQQALVVEDDARRIEVHEDVLDSHPPLHTSLTPRAGQ